MFRTGPDRSSLEQILCDLLRGRGIEFIEQFSTRSGFVLDFVIPPCYAIETDGPCHDSSKSKKRDRFRDKILKNEGWKIFRIKYNYFMNRIY